LTPAPLSSGTLSKLV